MEDKSFKSLVSLLEDFKERGVLFDCANLENFLSLEKRERIVYWGVDCTADSLHLGHLSIIIQLFKLSEKDFKVIFLLGGATTTIGDPSDKLKERPILKKGIIEENCKLIKEQLKKISRRNFNEVKDYSIPLSCFYEKFFLDKIYECLKLNVKKKPQEIWEDFVKKFLPRKGNSEFIFLNNEDWLQKINFLDFANDHGKNVTINYLLSKGTVKKRVESEISVSFSEFSYPLLQGCDFIHLYKNYKCNGQIGASDQWGNFSTGLKMLKNKFQKNKTFALSFNLMLDRNGKKMSKTGGKTSVIWMNKEKTQFNTLFDYFNNMEDSETEKFINKITSIKKEQISEILKINKPKSLRILQKILVEVFFFLIHGSEGTEWIRKNKNLVFGN